MQWSSLHALMCGKRCFEGKKKRKGGKEARKERDFEEKEREKGRKERNERERERDVSLSFCLSFSSFDLYEMTERSACERDAFSLCVHGVVFASFV